MRCSFHMRWPQLTMLWLKPTQVKKPLPGSFQEENFSGCGSGLEMQSKNIQLQKHMVVCNQVGQQVSKQGHPAFTKFQRGSDHTR